MDFGDLIFLTFMGLVVGGLLFFYIQIYNQLAANRDQVAKAFADIDVLLKQRHAELPALKAVAEAWAEHEAGLQQRLAELASQAQDASGLAERLIIENQFGILLWNFLGRREASPDLAAPIEFLKLQKRITELENAINARREGFNAQVAGHNSLLEQIPVKWLAPWLGHRGVPYLKDPRA